MNCIFYGAGLYAKRNLQRWLSQGYQPMCFSDSDTARHHTDFCGFKILPLDEAMEKYPGLPVYISVGGYYAGSIRKHLLERVPPDKILHPDGEWRLGCENLGLVLIGCGKGFIMHPCCGTMTEKHKYYVDNIKSAVQKYEAFVQRIIAAQKEKSGLCNRCAEYTAGFFSNEHTSKTITIGPSFKGDMCPLDCIYCNANKRSPLIELNNDKTVFDVLEELCGMPEATRGLQRVVLATLEPLVSPKFDETLELIAAHGWEAEILTTGVVYSPKTAELSNAGMDVTLNISLDCGTAETYKKIKNANCFDKVIENIKKYVKAGVAVDLKYIIVRGMNDNSADIEGFLAFAQGLHCRVNVTRDVNLRNERMNDKEKLALQEFLGRDKPSIHIVWGTFNKEDRLEFER